MANKKTNVCCVLLAVIIIFSCLGFSFGESYARYENSFLFKTVLVSEKTSAVGSDYLVMSTDAPLTVIAGEVSSGNRTKTVSFTLESSGSSAKNTLNLEVEHGSYMEVALSMDSVNLEHGAEIEVPAEGSKTVTMTITAKDAAFSTPHEETNSDVTVTWGDLTGTFRVIIPEVESQNPEGGEATEETEGEGNIGLDAPEAQNADPAAETPEETPKDEHKENSIMSISIFDASACLPVKVTLTGKITDATFGIHNSNKPDPEPFPAGTRFSLDNGESFNTCYGESTVKIKSEDIRNGSVLFDFSRTKLVEAESVSVAMRPWQNGVGESICSVTINTGAEKSFNSAEFSGENMLDMGMEEGAGENPDGKWKIFTLGKESSAEYFFPSEWSEAELTYSVLKLSLSESGTVVFENTDEVTAEYEIAEDGTPGLRISTAGKNPSAGTYRVFISWKYKDIVFYKTEIPFFIDYTVPSGNVPESQEVPYGN